MFHVLCVHAFVLQKRRVVQDTYREYQLDQTCKITHPVLYTCSCNYHTPLWVHRLDEVIDSQHDNVSKHLGQIADAMYEWEGPIAEQLGLKRPDIAAIKKEYPSNLKLQT